MDNKLLVGFLIFLAAFLILPIAMQKMKQGQSTTGPTAPGAAQPSAATSTANSNPELSQPPLLNEGNLIGTEWKMPQGQYVLKASLAAGGVCYITHPMAKAMTGMDYMEARWRVEYDKAYINASFAGKDYSYTLKISGSNLYYMGEGAPRKIDRW